MRKIVVLLLMSLALSTNATAAVIAYDNMPSNTYSGGGNWFGDNAMGATYALAQSFTSAASDTLDSLELGMYGPASTSITISLMNDNSGQLGTTTLWTGTYTNVLGSPGSIVSLTGLSGPALVSGTQYWIKAESSTVSTTTASWARNDQGASDVLALSQNSGPWTNYSGPAFAMRVGVLPEPATLALFAMGGLISLRRKR